jgi:hypothetical protein
MRYVHLLIGPAAMVLFATCLITVFEGSASAIATTVSLATAANFGVLGGTAGLNTAPSSINGGLSSGTSVTGFPPGTVDATVHVDDAVSAPAQSVVTAAYNDAAGQAPDWSITGDPGGLTLDPGVCNAGSSIGITNMLTLDGQGDPNAVFVFQVGSTLTTAWAARWSSRTGTAAATSSGRSAPRPLSQRTRVHGERPRPHVLRRQDRCQPDGRGVNRGAASGGVWGLYGGGKRRRGKAR